MRGRVGRNEVRGQPGQVFPGRLRRSAGVDLGKVTRVRADSRVVEQGDLRPMSGHSEAMQDLRDILSSREPLYSKADAQLNTSGKTVEQSITALERLIAQQ